MQEGIQSVATVLSTIETSKLRSLCPVADLITSAKCEIFRWEMRQSSAPLPGTAHSVMYNDVQRITLASVLS